MAVLKLSITTARPTAELVARFETAGGKQAIANRIVNYVTGVFSGSELAQDASNPPSIAISIQNNEVQASGTLTGTSVIATDAISINGVTFTCVASGATGDQFNVGASDTLTMAALAAAINASATALVTGVVTASSATNVCTVTSVAYGLSGNSITLASADGTIVASGARLTGGAADATAQTLSF